MKMPGYSADKKTIRIGTRGSKLALVQAEYVRSLLLESNANTLSHVEIEVISTAGDRSQRSNAAISEIGGKGLFTQEIEAKLLIGAIDIAVHSAKDMPTILPEGLDLVCIPERENPADGFVSEAYDKFENLPKGATVGSASLRRRAQMLRLRPDLNVVMFRGNVDTRLRKIKEGVADATLLAVAGLRRLGLENQMRCELPVEQFLPAPGQGAICIEAVKDNTDVLNLLRPLNHADSSVALAAERAFLDTLDGSCRTPIGALASISNGVVSLQGMILTPDGQQFHDGTRTGSVADAVPIGRSLADELKALAGSNFFDSW